MRRCVLDLFHHFCLKRPFLVNIQLRFPFSTLLALTSALPNPALLSACFFAMYGVPLLLFFFEENLLQAIMTSIFVYVAQSCPKRPFASLVKESQPNLNTRSDGNCPTATIGRIKIYLLLFSGYSHVPIRIPYSIFLLQTSASVSMFRVVSSLAVFRVYC